MKNQHKAKYGLVGYPLGHSLSPLMHNAAFKALSVDAEYKLFSLKEEELDGFFKGIKEKGSDIFGLNVTIPYKEKVLEFVDVLSPFAQKIRAVNTIVIKPDRTLVGYNTDGPGFLAHLTELGVQTKNKRIVILGAGGAARALISVLCLLPERPESIRIYDVDQEKGDSLIHDLGQRFDVDHVKTVPSIDDLNIELADVLINATPLGMKDNDLCLVDEGLLHPHLFVYDLIYNPSQTKLLKLAKSRGAKTSNGLGMLFYQGVLAFQHWADLEIDEPTKEIMRKSLLKGTKE